MLKKCACIETLFTELPFLERFLAAKKAGFDTVEFWSWDDKDLDAIAAAAKDAGIPIHAFSGDKDYSLIDPSQQERYLEFLRRSVKAANQLDCKQLVIHSNALGEGGIVVEHYDDLTDSLKEITMFQALTEAAKIAEAGGVTLVLEALNIVCDHVGNFLTTTAMGAEMVRTIGSPNLKLLYDAYHMQYNEGKLCYTVQEYCDCIGHVHIADVPGRHEPGTGEINYRAVISALEDSGYAGQLGFELFPKESTPQAVAAIMAL